MNSNFKNLPLLIHRHDFFASPCTSESLPPAWWRRCRWPPNRWGGSSWRRQSERWRLQCEKEKRFLFVKRPGLFSYFLWRRKEESIGEHLAFLSVKTGSNFTGYVPERNDILPRRKRYPTVVSMGKSPNSSSPTNIVKVLTSESPI